MNGALLFIASPAASIEEVTRWERLAHEGHPDIQWATHLIDFNCSADLILAFATQEHMVHYTMLPMSPRSLGEVVAACPLYALRLKGYRHCIVVYPRSEGYLSIYPRHIQQMKTSPMMELGIVAVWDMPHVWPFVLGFATEGTRNGHCTLEELFQKWYQRLPRS